MPRCSMHEHDLAVAVLAPPPPLWAAVSAQLVSMHSAVKMLVERLRLLQTLVAKMQAGEAGACMHGSRGACAPTCDGGGMHATMDHGPWHGIHCSLRMQGHPLRVSALDAVHAAMSTYMYGTHEPSSPLGCARAHAHAGRPVRITGTCAMHACMSVCARMPRVRRGGVVLCAQAR